MPVKVKCPKCEKVLNVPDAARGKAVKCPACEARVSVPAEDAAPAKSVSKPAASPKAAAGKPSAKPAKAKKTTSDDDDFLDALDMGRVEDESVRLCPKCGAPLYDEEEAECPACGVDVRTGQHSARRKRKMALKGADPSEFYKAAWSDSWEYLINHISLTMRLTGLWTAFVVLITLCYYGLRVWTGYDLGYTEGGEPFNSLWLAVQYTIPLVGDSPPQIFWKGLAIVIYLGFPGTYWSISHQIISGTLESRDKPFKVVFEIVTSVALGIKSLVWAYVLVLPFAWTGLAGLLPILCFPIAMVHMTRPYAHPAWIPWDMLRIFFKNMGQSLYWLMMAFATYLPATLIIGLGALFFPSTILPTFQGWASGAAEWLSKICGESTPGWMYGLFHPLISLILAAALAFVIFLFVAFPSVFMMRANGLLGFFCKNQLDLIGKVPKGQPCGFWPRWLAFLIDSFVLGIAIGAIVGAVGGLIYVVPAMGLEAMIYPLFAVGVLGVLLVHGMYYVRSECSALQGTLGKRAIGLIVVDMKGNRIKQNTSMGRWALRFLIPGGYFGGIMAAFSENKQALHDSITKTQVVWEGE